MYQYALEPNRVPGIPLMASFYGWAQDDAEGILMVLLDDGTEPIPPSHSGTSFPGNRTGTLARRDFTVKAASVAEVHLVVDVDLITARRATVIVRGRRAPAPSRVAPGEGIAADISDAPVHPARAARGTRPGGPGGLIFGSAGLRFVPNAYRDVMGVGQVTVKE